MSDTEQFEPIEINHKVHVADLISVLSEMPADKPVAVIGYGPICGVFETTASDGDNYMVLSTASDEDQLNDMIASLNKAIDA
jgi:hypothetical protein